MCNNFWSTNSMRVGKCLFLLVFYGFHGACTQLSLSVSLSLSLSQTAIQTFVEHTLTQRAIIVHFNYFLVNTVALDYVMHTCVMHNMQTTAVEKCLSQIQKFCSTYSFFSGACFEIDIRITLPTSPLPSEKHVELQCACKVREAADKIIAYRWVHQR